MPPRFRFLRHWFGRRRVDAEMSDELAHHLELLAADNIRRGMSPEEARYAAQRSFGGLEQVKERCREVRPGLWFSQFCQDVGYGVRSLRKNLGFTIAGVLTLGIGVGVNTTVISAINDMLWRPVAPAADGSLVVARTRQIGTDRTYRPFSYREYEGLRDAHAIFSEVAAMQLGYSLMGEGDDVQRRMLCVASGNYFDLLRVTPLRGRFFSAEEAEPSLDRPVLVASYELWQRQGGREDFVGSQLRVDRRKYTVIGIAPRGFGGLQWSVGPDAWVPFGVAPHLVYLWGQRAASRQLTDPKAQQLQVFGRLRPGLSLEAARARLAPVAADLNVRQGLAGAEMRELSLAKPPRTNLDLTTPTDESKLALYASTGLAMTLLVLLVACVNVANMMFGRSVSRQKEIAIRLCLGASRGRIVRQLLVEGLLLSLLGGLAGLLLSRWSNDLMLGLTRSKSVGVALHLQTTYDWPILVGTFSLAVLATLAVALAPALRATRRDLVQDLKQPLGGQEGGSRMDRMWSWRQGLVIGQVALSLTLIFCAGVLVHAVVVSEQGRGFATDHRLVANVDYGISGTPQDTIRPRQRALLQAVAKLPGVERAALASAVPFNFNTNWWAVFRLGDPTDHPAVSTAVTAGYFAALGIPLLRGREFTVAESVEGEGRRVAVIDESLGRVLFGEADPLGQFIALNRIAATQGRAADQMEIVGVVRSPREDAFQHAAPQPRIYLPFAQVRQVNTYVHVTLQRGADEPAMVERLRHEMRAVDPETPVLACDTLANLIGQNLNVWTARLLAGLFSVFGVVAVVLAVVGVYGVKAYLVARRAQEVGIRIAIGARPSAILGLFLRRSLMQTLVGVALGSSLALLAGQGLAKLFYGVGPVDAVTLAAAALTVAAASTLAGLIPAWRATRINPIDALRAE